jgi:hypothetical protein
MTKREREREKKMAFSVTEMPLILHHDKLSNCDAHEMKKLSDDNLAGLPDCLY